MSNAPTSWINRRYLARIGAGLGAAIVLGYSIAMPAPARAGGAPAGVSLPLALNWKFTATQETNNPSAPCVIGNSVFIASGDRVYALDLATGAQKWKYPQDAPMSTKIHTSPSVYGDIIYVGADDGKLYAIQTDTGQGKWLFDTRSSVGSSPAIADGVVYFGSADGKLWAIDTRTGVEVPTWRGGFKASDEFTGAPVVANGLVYAISLDQVLHAVSVATGQERAVARLGGRVMRQSPVVSGDNVVAASGSQVGCFNGRNLQLRWSKMLPTDVAVTPTVTDTAVYVITADDKMYSFDLRTGKPLWRTTPQLQYEVIAPATASGGLLFIGAVQGGLYAMDAATGAIKWVYATQPDTSRDDAVPTWTNIAASPVAAGDQLLVLSDDGSVSAFKSNGTDALPPMITPVEPVMGVVINGTPPIHFEAKIADEGSGVDPASIRLMIDDEGVTRRPEGRENEDKPGFKYDILSTVLEYDTPEPTTASLVRPLGDGRHTVSITVSDWAGNTVTKKWSFIVDNSVAKKPRKKANQNNSNQGMPGMGGGLGAGGMGGGRGGRRGGGGGGAGSGG